jgi:hypothetical protein
MGKPLWDILGEVLVVVLLIMAGLAIIDGRKDDATLSIVIVCLIRVNSHPRRAEEAKTP